MKSEQTGCTVTCTIQQNKIGIVIGPGGRTIKKIVQETGAKIDIEDNGQVKISAKTDELAERARFWVTTLAGDIKVGTRLTGKIRKFMEFGIFVELVPGKDGLIHISRISKEKQDSLTSNYRVDDEIAIEVASYDPSNGRIGLVAAELA